MAKNKKVPLPKSFTNPRQMSVLEKENEQYLKIAGQKQYQIKVLESELALLNNKVFELNQEADASKKFYAKPLAPVEPTLEELSK